MSAIAPTRRGAAQSPVAPGSPVATESAVWALLRTVPDPEIPTVSVVDLGIVRSVAVTPERIRVELLPTFVGCPAIEAMREAVAEKLVTLAPEVEVVVSYAEPWTSERITLAGREKLRRSGFAPPAGGAPTDELGSRGPLLIVAPVARCPYCDSPRTLLENGFGPTQCRSIYFCTACRQPFEQFKSV